MSGCDKPHQGERYCDLTEPPENREPQITRKVLGSININIVSNLVQDGNENVPTSSNTLSIDIGTFTSSSGSTAVGDTQRKNLKRNAEDADLVTTPIYETAQKSKKRHDDFSVEDKNRIFKSFAAEEEAKLLLFGQRKNYTVAMSKLEEVHLSHAHASLLKTFMMIECAAQLGLGNAPTLIREAVEGLMALEQEDKVLYDLAKLYEGRGFDIKAVIMYRCACRSSSIKRKQNDACSPIAKYLCCVKKIITKMSKRLQHEFGFFREIAVDHMLPLMEDILSDLRSLKPDRERASLEGTCLSRIASSYNDLNEHHKTINFCEQGLERMKDMFGENARKNRAYVQLLDNLGLAHRALGHKQDALSSFKQAAELRQGWSREEREKSRHTYMMYLNELHWMKDVKSESQVGGPIQYV